MEIPRQSQRGRMGRWLACVVSLVAACEREATAPPTALGGGVDRSSGVTVIVGNNFFSPTVAHLNASGVVTWKWIPGGVAHNVTVAGGPRSPTQSSGAFSHQFEPGTYAYSCTIHPEMRGQLVVH